jgi:putative SOS response-associated peptidase YedK
MCYDIKASYEAQLQRAQRDGDESAIAEIREKLMPLTDLPIYHASGFSHPDLLIYTDRSPFYPEVATWGLIPHWITDEKAAKNIWNKTLNARGESILEKPSFRDAAKTHRCIVYIDGFYEHHHFEGKTYPFYIYRKDRVPLALAGLYSDWQNDHGGITRSFTIVTTTGNALLEKIHNNPKLTGSRMPLILTENQAEQWLNVSLDEPILQQLIRPFLEDKLAAHPVGKLRGKEYKGNVPGVSEAVDYPELMI